jgi:hypothetical protein
VLQRLNETRRAEVYAVPMLVKYGAVYTSLRANFRGTVSSVQPRANYDSLLPCTGTAEIGLATIHFRFHRLSGRPLPPRTSRGAIRSAHMHSGMARGKMAKMASFVLLPTPEIAHQRA